MYSLRITLLDIYGFTHQISCKTKKKLQKIPRKSIFKYLLGIENFIDFYLLFKYCRIPSRLSFFLFVCCFFVLFFLWNFPDFFFTKYSYAKRSSWTQRNALAWWVHIKRAVFRVWMLITESLMMIIDPFMTSTDFWS